MSFLYLLAQLLFFTLKPVAVIAVEAIGIGLGMLAALFLYSRMADHEWKRADELVTRADLGPSNVYYLTPQIEADHRQRRVMRLLDRS